MGANREWKWYYKIEKSKLWKENMDYREMPERLDRKVIYESDYVCLYADKVKLSNGYIIEKYHQIHYLHEAISIVVFNENDEVLLIPFCV